MYIDALFKKFICGYTRVITLELFSIQPTLINKSVHFEKKRKLRKIAPRFNPIRNLDIWTSCNKEEDESTLYCSLVTITPENAVCIGSVTDSFSYVTTDKTECHSVVEPLNRNNIPEFYKARVPPPVSLIVSSIHHLTVKESTNAAYSSNVHCSQIRYGQTLAPPPDRLRVALFTEKQQTDGPLPITPPASPRLRSSTAPRPSRTLTNAQPDIPIQIVPRDLTGLSSTHCPRHLFGAIRIAQYEYSLHTASSPLVCTALAARGIVPAVHSSEPSDFLCSHCKCGLEPAPSSLNDAFAADPTELVVRNGTRAEVAFTLAGGASGVSAQTHSAGQSAIALTCDAPDSADQSLLSRVVSRHNKQLSAKPNTTKFTVVSAISTHHPLCLFNHNHQEELKNSNYGSCSFLLALLRSSCVNPPYPQRIFYQTPRYFVYKRTFVNVFTRI